MRPANRQPAAHVLQRCGGHACPSSGCASGPSTDDETLRRFSRTSAGLGHAGGVAPPIVMEVLRSQGQALDPSVSADMRARFRHDFSRVRVHADSVAARSSAAVDAVAYTVGSHLVFAQGAYQPHTRAGRSVLAHELAHVVQQRGGDSGTATRDLRIGPPDDGHERNAEAWAQAITSRGYATPVRPPAATGVQKGPTRGQIGAAPRPTSTQARPAMVEISHAATEAALVPQQAHPGIRRATSVQRCGGQSCPPSGCSDPPLGTLRRYGGVVGRANGPPKLIDAVLRAAGEPLDVLTRSTFEQGFGRAFADVRVHTDVAAAASARAVGAVAYTVGKHVVFGTGRYAPRTHAGRRLLGHELTHVVQQRASGNVLASQLSIGAADDPAEAEADRVAAVLTNDGGLGQRGPPVHASPATSGGSQVVRRQADISAAPPLPCVTVVGPGHPSGFEFKFELSDATLTEAQRRTIRTFARSWLAGTTKPDIIVDGFASVDGPQELNWRLSCDRAEAIVTALVTEGVPRGRTTTFAHGESTEFSRTLLPPNRRAILSTIAAPPPPSTPACGTLPPCPLAAPAPLPRDPHIRSGSLCRGACGPNCPPTCTPQPAVTLCVPDSTGTCHAECTYPGVIRCGSHAGCRTHDSCYDTCAAAGDPFGTCHRGCDIDCLRTHGFTRCNSWRTGGGPFDRMIDYSDPPTRSGPLPGACP